MRFAFLFHLLLDASEAICTLRPILISFLSRTNPISVSSPLEFSWGSVVQTLYFFPSNALDEPVNSNWLKTPV